MLHNIGPFVIGKASRMKALGGKTILLLAINPCKEKKQDSHSPVFSLQSLVGPVSLQSKSATITRDEECPNSKRI